MHRPDSPLLQREALRLAAVCSAVAEGNLNALRDLERDGCVRGYTEGIKQINRGFYTDFGTPLLGCIQPTQGFYRRFGYAGVLEAVEILVRNGADLSAEGMHSHANALDMAAMHGDPALVTFLLDNGCAVNRRNIKGETALYGTRRVDVMQVLVERGADLANRSLDGWTSLHQFTFFGHAHHQQQHVQLLIDAGADVNAVDNNNETPLYHAVYSSDRDMAEILLANGANIDTVSTVYGFTVLTMATRPGPVHPCLQPIQEEIQRRAAILAEANRVANWEAFAMGLHDRLGRESIVHELDENLARMVLREHDV
jgi:hypothetical protein